MAINNRYYDWGFQSRFSAMAIILSMDMIYSTMERIVPSRCRLTARHLGATLLKVEITSKMQVPCHCQHAPWHLGANAKSFFAHFIEDPNHHIVMSRPLGATNCSWQKFKTILGWPGYTTMTIADSWGLHNWILFKAMVISPGLFMLIKPALGGYR